MANQYLNNMTALWNSAGTTYAAIKMNVTNAASAAGSNLIQMQVGAVDKFTVDKTGSVVASGIITATGGLVTSGTLLPATNDTAALGISGTAWSDLFLASGGVINWAAGDITITHGTNQMLFGGASAGYLFDSPIKPTSHDLTSIGQIGTAWSDIFLASGAVIDFNSTDVTIAHTADTLTVGGGDFRVALPGADPTSVVTLGAPQTLTSKTLTSPVINTPTLNTPTIATPTVTGTATMATISATGTITSASTITAGASIVANQNLISSTATVVVAPTGAGSILLRPNGAASSAGQVGIDASGNITTPGNIGAGPNLTLTGTSALVGIKPSGASNGHVWFYAADGVTTRAIIYTTAGAQGPLNITVGGQNFQFDPDGQMHSPQAIFCASSFLGTDGNISGSVWDNIGAHDAYTAIVNRIESRALAWANDRVAAMQFRKVSLGFNGTSGGFSNLGAGTVIVGYAREGGTTGQVQGLYYATLQSYDPARNTWTSFLG
jgi:hypothetical protein